MRRRGLVAAVAQFPSYGPRRTSSRSLRTELCQGTGARLEEPARVERARRTRRWSGVPILERVRVQGTRVFWPRERRGRAAR